MSDLKTFATGPGKFSLGTVKVKAIGEKTSGAGKPYWLVYVEGYADRLFSSQKPPFEAETEVSINIEAKDGQNGNLSFFLDLPKPQGQGGGGGGFKSAPKTPAEIHSSCIAGIIKSGLERPDGVMSPADLRTYIDLYCESVKRFS